LSIPFVSPTAKCVPVENRHRHASDQYGIASTQHREQKRSSSSCNFDCFCEVGRGGVNVYCVDRSPQCGARKTNLPGIVEQYVQICCGNWTFSYDREGLLKYVFLRGSNHSSVPCSPNLQLYWVPCGSQRESIQ